MFTALYAQLGGSISPMVPVLLTVCGAAILTALFSLKSRLAAIARETPTLTHQDTPLSRHVLRQCRRLGDGFQPPLWAINPHLQTIVGSLVSEVEFAFDRTYVSLSDGGVVALDWGVVRLGDDSPVLLVFPGLTGTARGMSFLCRRAESLGYRPIVFNKRGHGDSKLATPKLQSFGDATDVRQVVDHVKELYPYAQLVAIGVSAGSALLMSYLGEYGAGTDLAAAAMVSPGYRAELLFSGKVHFIYDRVLLNRLKSLLRQHRAVLDDVVDVKHALGSKTLMEFEERVYRRIYGFRDMAEYWEKNEPMRNASNVATPVLCISALDDPVCRRELITHDMFLSHPDVMLVTTRRGGHCGFVESGTLEPWSDKLCLDYLGAVLNAAAQAH